MRDTEVFIEILDRSSPFKSEGQRGAGGEDKSPLFKRSQGTAYRIARLNYDGLLILSGKQRCRSKSAETRPDHG
jgi:hypothetical protein